MKKIETIIFTREDLVDKKLDFELINTDNFDKETINKSGMVLFIDDNGDTKILKNRFGNDSSKQDRIYNLLKKIYDLSGGPWDDIVITEDLYFEMESVLKYFDSKNTIY